MKAPKLLRGGRIVVPGPDGRVIDDCAVLFSEKILGIIPENRLDGIEFGETIDARGAFVAPGFINIHVHGADGADVMDGTPEALEKVGAFLLKTGVTSYMATTLTAPLDHIDPVLDVARGFVQNPGRGANVLGVHLEGPFIDAGHKGAHDERFIIPPDDVWIARHSDIIKIVTFAPEHDESGNFAKVLVSHGIVPSLGHSGATCECALRAVGNGARTFTHLFNAMSPLHHREPGMVGAALISSCWVELIADGIHVSSLLFEPICAAKGPDKVILITDSMRAAGLPDGPYELGGLAVTVANGAARLTGTTVLAGSVLLLNHALRNMSHATQRPLWEIVGMATVNPAKMLGITNKGTIEPGMDADLVCFDDSFEITNVVRGGEKML